MPIQTRYLLIVGIDFPQEMESTFNEIYEEHVANMLGVPGVRSATRLIREQLRYSSGGNMVEVADAGEPKFTAVWELDSPEVLTSAEWARQAALGRWATMIRPKFQQFRLGLHRVLYASP